MEPACQSLLENPAPPDKDPDLAPQSLVYRDRARRGAVQSKPSALYLKLLSLRMGLLGWFVCLKKIQWDVVRWIYISLELATDVFFTWLQNALLASMMLLLLAWKVHSAARQHGWRMLLHSLISEVQQTWGLSLLRGCCGNLKSVVTCAAWAPAYCFTWIVRYMAQTLEAIFIHAVMMAGDDNAKEAIEEAMPESRPAPVLPQEEPVPSAS